MALGYGVIGLGVIGSGMASNLRKKLPPSTTLHVYDINTEACQKLVAEYGSFGKVETATSAKDLASKCHTVLSSLPAGKHVRAVFLDAEHGVIAAPKDSDRLLIDCSTIEIESTREVGRTIIDSGSGAYVDAPVAGGMWGAVTGTLSFMVGHSRPTETDAVGKRILETLSLVGVPETIRFCGGLSMGQVAKIAHNYVCISNLLVATEGMAIGLKYGIDKDVLYECMTDGCANSWVMGLEQPVPGLVDKAPSSNGYRKAFTASLGVKDLTIANASAKRHGIDPSAGEAAIKAFQKVDADPRTQDLDHTSLWLHVMGQLEEASKSRL